MDGQLHLAADKDNEKIFPKVLTEAKDWSFEGLLRANKMERTNMRGRLHAVHDVCRTKQIVAPERVLDVSNLESKVVLYLEDTSCISKEMNTCIAGQVGRHCKKGW